MKIGFVSILAVLLLSGCVGQKPEQLSSTPSQTTPLTTPLPMVTPKVKNSLSGYSVSIKFQNPELNVSHPSAVEGDSINISVFTCPPVKKDVQLYMIINNSEKIVSEGVLENGKYTFSVTLPDSGRNRIIAFRAKVGKIESNTLSIDVLKKLDLSSLKDDEIISLAMKNDSFRKKYDGWEFRITERRPIEKDGEPVLYVNAWAGRDNWEIVNQVWFYINEKGEMKGLGIYPYIKTSMPVGLSEKEVQKLVKIALNDSTVKSLLSNKTWTVVHAVELKNPFNNRSYGKQLYFHIKNTTTAYVVSFQNERVVNIRETTWFEQR